MDGPDCSPGSPARMTPVTEGVSVQKTKDKVPLGEPTIVVIDPSLNNCGSYYVHHDDLELHSVNPARTAGTKELMLSVPCSY